MSTTFSLALERAHYYREVSALYTNNGWDRLKRHWKYIRSPREESSLSSSVALTLIIGGAILGAKSGKKIGSEIEKIVTSDSNRGRIGGEIGAGVGLVVGAGTGGYLYMTLAERSPFFAKWKLARLDDAIKAAITYSYSNDEVLTNFTCPVSLCVMDIPAHTPPGVVYDYIYILHCPRESNGYIKDPHKNSSYSEENVLPDFEMALVIQKRARHLLKTDIAQLQGEPMLQQPLLDQLREIGQNVINRYENAREAIEERRRNKVTNNTEYKREIEEFEKLFGVDPEQELDWSINWVETLKSRWEKFHPKS